MAKQNHLLTNPNTRERMLALRSTVYTHESLARCVGGVSHEFLMNNLHVFVTYLAAELYCSVTMAIVY